MYPLLETIRLENGELMNLAYHEKRIDRSLKQLYGIREIPPVNEMILLNKQHNSGVFKCRLLYSNVGFKLSIEKYEKRPIDRLILLEKPEIMYDLKYSDRSVFDDIIIPDKNNTEIIFTRNSILTDTRYTNIAVEKNEIWFTPASPLLAGTQRALLIDNGIIEPAEIRKSDLKTYSKIRLFNAMMPWDDCIELDISQIGGHD